MGLGQFSRFLSFHFIISGGMGKSHGMMNRGLGGWVGEKNFCTRIICWSREIIIKKFEAPSDKKISLGIWPMKKKEGKHGRTGYSVFEAGIGMEQIKNGHRFGCISLDGQ